MKTLTFTGATESKRAPQGSPAALYLILMGMDQPKLYIEVKISFSYYGEKQAYPTLIEKEIVSLVFQGLRKNILSLLMWMVMEVVKSVLHVTLMMPQALVLTAIPNLLTFGFLNRMVRRGCQREMSGINMDTIT